VLAIAQVPPCEDPSSGAVFCLQAALPHVEQSRCLSWINTFSSDAARMVMPRGTRENAAGLARGLAEADLSATFFCIRRAIVTRLLVPKSMWKE